MKSEKLTEDDVRSALGLFKYKSEQKSTTNKRQTPSKKMDPVKNTVTIEYCVRKKTGGSTFNYIYHSNSISLFEAEMEAAKDIESQGLDIWFIVDRRRNS